MATAWQSNAFQNNAFQIDAVATQAARGTAGWLAPPYSGYESRKRTKEEIREERERYGILPKTARIIEDIAARQAMELRLDEQQRFEELQRELALQRIEWEGKYLEYLNALREQLIAQEIGMRLRNKMQEEENILLLMVAATA